jgi:hypothetical protein
MNKSKEKKDTKFQVDLKGLSLPDDVLSNLNLEIQQTVLKEIAKIDTEGDRFVRIKFPDCRGGNIPVNRTWGIVIINGERVDFPG